MRITIVTPINIDIVVFLVHAHLNVISQRIERQHATSLCYK